VQARIQRGAAKKFALLNGVDFTSSESTMKVSLNQQIDEVERELEVRRDVYPRMVATHKMRQSIADFQMQRMNAVLRTLRWFQKHEDKIRSLMSDTDKAEE
jgi:hypothetical protein